MPPRFRTMLARTTLHRRCPVCGHGRIFDSALHLGRACTHCRWILEREPGSVTGAMYLIAIVTQFFAVFLLALFWVLTDWSNVTKLVVALPLLLAFSLAALPFARAIWVAIEYFTDVRSGEVDNPEYARRAYARSEPPKRPKPMK